MPRYYFTVRWVDRVDDDKNGASLSDDAAALDRACQMARELQIASGDSDPGLVIVKNEKHHTVLSNSFPGRLCLGFDRR